ATGDWILVLDADELVPEPLSRRLMEIASDDVADVVLCPFRTFLLGTAMKGTGWGPRHEVHLRFYRRGCVSFSPEVHSSPVPCSGSRVIDLRDEEPSGQLAIQHFAYLGFHDFVDRLNRYTSIEANQASARGETISLLRTITRAVREFAWRLLRAGGYRDGWRGVHLSVLMGVYRWVSSAKQQQLKAVGSDDAIKSLYIEVAEGLLSAYRKDTELGAHVGGASRGGSVES
ncbi:MAG: hypothetical protein ACRD1T_00575, partial [Acidimicrobiia bacterium]